MDMDRITAAAATRFPHLFKWTYWGAFTLAPNDHAITPAIIENRNRFAEGRRLASRVRMPSMRPERRRGEDFDHVELYRDKAGWLVLVCSNYGETPPPAALDMEPVPPLYSVGVCSWAARYATRKELNARLKACAGGGAPFAVRLDAGRGNAGGEVRGASRGQPGPRAGVRGAEAEGKRA